MQSKDMEYPGEKLNAGLPEAMFTVTSWLYSGGDIPLLTVQDGLLEPDVPGFQQTSLLELVVSGDHFGTSPVQSMVMGTHISCQSTLS